MCSSDLRALSIPSLCPKGSLYARSGPLLARNARDAARLLDVVAGQDPLDPTSSPRPAGDCEAACGQPVEELRIGIPDSYYYDETSPAVGEAVAAAKDAFAGLGVTIRTVQVPDHENINLIWAAALSAEAATIHRRWLR